LLAVLGVCWRSWGLGGDDVREQETFRHHSDHGESDGDLATDLERESAADDGGIPAEFPSPEIVADDRDAVYVGCGIQAVFRAEKVARKSRLDAHGNVGRTGPWRPIRDHKGRGGSDTFT
jgi:hypothetical protein